MAEREFRLPGSPYEELVNIIVAYGTRDEAAGPGDVSKLDSVHQSSVSRNKAFLVEIGVLRGEQQKLVTRRGRSLALALARRDREEIRRNWRSIVATSEFLQNVVAAVKLREGMLYGTLQAFIAHSAGQPRNKPVMNGASAIIDILKAAGLLREEAGELIAPFDEEPELDAPAPGDMEVAHELPEPPEELASATLEADGENGSPAVTIHLHVRCEPDDLEDLAPRLKALLKELSR